MAYVKTPRGMIYYELANNSKPPLVMCQGLSRSIEYWMGFDKELHKYFNVILVESGGIGRSAEQYQLPWNFSMFDYADNIVAVLDELKIAMPEAIRRYDKNGDQHYNVVSAFIKSMRGSDVNASIHYLARMLAAGENIEYIARRIIICAAEDVGLADPQALTVATSCFQAIKISDHLELFLHH